MADSTSDRESDVELDSSSDEELVLTPKKRSPPENSDSLPKNKRHKFAFPPPPSPPHQVSESENGSIWRCDGIGHVQIKSEIDIGSPGDKHKDGDVDDEKVAEVDDPSESGQNKDKPKIKLIDLTMSSDEEAEENARRELDDIESVGGGMLSEGGSVASDLHESSIKDEPFDGIDGDEINGDASMGRSDDDNGEIEEDCNKIRWQEIEKHRVGLTRSKTEYKLYGKAEWKEAVSFPAHVLKEYHQKKNDFKIGAKVEHVSSCLVVDQKLGGYSSGFICKIRSVGHSLRISTTQSHRKIYFGVNKRVSPAREIQEGQIFSEDSFLNLKLAKITQVHESKIKLPSGIRILEDVEIGPQATLYYKTFGKPTRSVNIILESTNLCFMKMRINQTSMKGWHGSSLQQSLVTSGRFPVALVSHIDHEDFYAARFDIMNIRRIVRNKMVRLSSLSFKDLNPESVADAKYIFDLFLVKKGQSPPSADDILYAIITENLSLILLHTNDDDGEAGSDAFVIKQLELLPGEYSLKRSLSDGALEIDFEGHQMQYNAWTYDKNKGSYDVQNTLIAELIVVCGARADQYFNLDKPRSTTDDIKRMGLLLKYYWKFLPDSTAFIKRWLTAFSGDKECLRVISELYGQDIDCMPLDIQTFFTDKTLPELLEEAKIAQEMNDRLRLTELVDEAETSHGQEFYDSYEWYKIVVKIYGENKQKMKHWFEKFLKNASDEAIFAIMEQYAIAKGFRPSAFKATYMFVDIAVEVDFDKIFRIAIQTFAVPHEKRVYGVTIIEWMANKHEIYTNDVRALFNKIAEYVANPQLRRGLCAKFMKGQAAGLYVGKGDDVFDDMNDLYVELRKECSQAS